MYGFGDHDDQQGQDNFGGSNAGGNDPSGGSGRQDGPNSDSFGTSLTYDRNQSSLDAGLAVAMFGNQLGPQIAGKKGLTRDNASNLAGRMNEGQLAMEGLNFGIVGALLNEIGKYSAKRVVEQIAQGATPVYGARGFITGAMTDERGLVAGYQTNNMPNFGGNDGGQEGTFTSSNKPKNTSVTSSSSAIAMSDYEKQRSGSADSSGSGRRSLLRKVY